MSEVSNDQIYTVLLGIKEDIGGLKTSSGLQLEAIKNHSTRIVALEDGAATQKGASRVWATVAGGAGAVLGSAVAMAAAWIKNGH